MKTYAEKVWKALSEDRNGTLEVQLTPDMTCFESRTFARELYERGIGLLSLGRETYAFALEKLQENGTYAALEELGRKVGKMLKDEPWKRAARPVYRDICETLQEASNGEPEAVGRLCDFIHEAYGDPCLQGAGPLLEGIREGIKRLSVYVEFTQGIHE